MQKAFFPEFHSSLETPTTNWHSYGYCAKNEVAIYSPPSPPLPQLG